MTAALAIATDPSLRSDRAIAESLLDNLPSDVILAKSW
jgi:hypothetical protein